MRAVVQCKAKTKHGKRCKNVAQAESQFCRLHKNSRANQPPQLSDLHPTIEDFDKEPVKCAIKEAMETNGLPYQAMNRAARSFRDAGERRSADALDFLACVEQAFLDPSDVRRPLRPMFEFENSRGIIPDDFDEQQVDVIQSLAPRCENPVLRARLFDVTWLRTRNNDAAGKAISAYLAAATFLLVKWSGNEAAPVVHALEHIERAVRLTLFAFNKDDSLAKVTSALLKFSERMLKEEEFGLFSRVEDLIFELRLANAGERSDFVESAIGGSGAKMDPHLVRDLWLLAANWHQRDKDEKKERSARINAAETMVALASLCASGPSPSFMQAATHLSEALKIYRRVSGEHERREELRAQLNDYQSKMRGEMASFSTEIDLTKMVKETKRRISGKPLGLALTTLALMNSPSDPGELRKRVEEQAGKFPLQFLMSASVTDRDGRTIDMVPSLLSGDDAAAKEKAMRYHMMRIADLDYTVVSGGIIEPAISLIREEHFISPQVMRPVAERSLLVPDGHEELFAKGLAAGLNGDYATALHILIPQLENALREFLKGHGKTVSTREKDDNITQEAVTLGKILEHETIRNALGEGFVFDLESVLSDRLGTALRHDLAHGLRGDAVYWGGGAVAYAFWLIFRLVLLPLTVTGSKDEACPATEKGGGS